jgi:hypothetical protein
MKKCFIISPIGDEGSEEQKHANNVLDFIIKPALSEHNVKGIRSDELLQPGRITDQMFSLILQSDFCIVLLTGCNPNVFYELAISQAAGIPVIILMLKGQKLPFDIKDLRCIFYDFEPRPLMVDKTYTIELVSHIANLDKTDWSEVALLERYGLNRVRLPESYKFSNIVSEISDTINSLEAPDERLIQYYREQGDLERLFDGLYSSLIYASRSAITGEIDARFYGNLMEFDCEKKEIRVRYFDGPYNDQIITRRFPIDGPKRGVAGDAINTKKVQVKNKMSSELKERGEARLNAMISVPIPNINLDSKSRAIVIMNVDSGIHDIFPKVEEWSSSDVAANIEEISYLVERVNFLYRKFEEDI